MMPHPIGISEVWSFAVRQFLEEFKYGIVGGGSMFAGMPEATGNFIGLVPPPSGQIFAFSISLS